ncbi:hypothetical protein OO013_02075 [Mangrovivirga sp. M17]|uniref:Uncharacterized protein n=1 Tax=Mangrovivirga halotolerans TaxID=2993936 RepID=A0ABT3RLG4_9BACT|nr:hypothetical protein [Mangrovivirga halotolerans]MCX2742631.1 hypothetical protein [Mangrovivirga halotolerans]
MANKTVPDKIRKEVYETLKYFPELTNTHIDFVFTKNISKSFMQAQPNFSDILKRKDKRRYRIKITPALQLTEGSIPVEDLPEDVLMGWIAHELGHIMDYKDRSALAMMGFGISYSLNKKFLMSAEQTADIYAVNQGLGRKIRKTKNFILNRSDIPEDYKNRIKNLYLSPEEIMALIEENTDSSSGQSD